jgi:hypothetical protein
MPPLLNTPTFRQLCVLLDKTDKHILLHGSTGSGKSDVVRRATSVYPTLWIDDGTRNPGSSTAVSVLDTEAGRSYVQSLILEVPADAFVVVDDADLLLNAASVQLFLGCRRRCIFVCTGLEQAASRTLKAKRNVTTIRMAGPTKTDLMMVLKSMCPKHDVSCLADVVNLYYPDIRKIFLQAPLAIPRQEEACPSLQSATIFERANAVLRRYGPDPRVTFATTDEVMGSDGAFVTRVAWAHAPTTARSIEQLERELAAFSDMDGAPQAYVNARVPMLRHQVCASARLAPNYSSLVDGRPRGDKTVTQRNAQLYTMMRQWENTARRVVGGNMRFSAQRRGELWRLLNESGVLYRELNTVYEPGDLQKDLKSLHKKKRAAPTRSAIKEPKKPKKDPKQRTLADLAFV